MKKFLIVLAMALIPTGGAQAGNSAGTVGAIYVLVQAGDPNTTAYAAGTGIFSAGARADKPACGQTEVAAQI